MLEGQKSTTQHPIHHVYTKHWIEAYCHVNVDTSKLPLIVHNF